MGRTPLKHPRNEQGQLLLKQSWTSKTKSIQGVSPMSGTRHNQNTMAYYGYISKYRVIWCYCMRWSSKCGIMMSHFASRRGKTQALWRETLGFLSSSRVRLAVMRQVKPSEIWKESMGKYSTTVEAFAASVNFFVIAATMTWRTSCCAASMYLDK